jgi:hypothetical protein
MKYFVMVMLIALTSCTKFNTAYYTTMDEAVNAFPEPFVEKTKIDHGDINYDEYYWGKIEVRYRNGF